MFDFEFPGSFSIFHFPPDSYRDSVFIMGIYGCLLQSENYLLLLDALRLAPCALLIIMGIYGCFQFFLTLDS